MLFGVPFLDPSQTSVFATSLLGIAQAWEYISGTSRAARTSLSQTMTKHLGCEEHALVRVKTLLLPTHYVFDPITSTKIPYFMIA